VRTILIASLLVACHAAPMHVPPRAPVPATAVAPVVRHMPSRSDVDDVTLYPLAELISTGHGPCDQRPAPPHRLPSPLDEDAPTRFDLALAIPRCKTQRRPGPGLLF
jgi:hypothetical protein